MLTMTLTATLPNNSAIVHNPRYMPAHSTHGSRMPISVPLTHEDSLLSDSESFPQVFATMPP